MERTKFSASRLFLAVWMATGLAAGLAAAPTRPEAKAGFLDLRGYDLSGGEPLPLKGEWEFTFSGDGARSLQPVPANWQRYLHGGRRLPAYGRGTYRLRVLTDGGSERYGLRLKRIYSAYRVYVDGRLVEEAGSIAPRLEDTKPQLPVKTAYFEASGPVIEIVIDVANPYYYRSGILLAPVLGTQPQIARIETAAVASDIFLLGIISIMALYYLVYFLMNRRDTLAELYFAVFCVIVGLRASLIMGERYLYFIFPNLDLAVDLKIEAMVIYTLVPAFLLFLSQMFKREANHKLVLGITVVSGVYLVTSLVLPGRYFGSVLTAYFPILVPGFFYSVVIVGKAIRNKTTGAVIEAFGLASVAVVTVHDMLLDRELITGDYVLHVGLIVFIALQSVLLARRYSNALRQEVRMSGHLAALLDVNRKIRDELETRVQERTTDLTALNERLVAARNHAEEASTAKSRFLATMSHEMRTPLTGIIGYAELLQKRLPGNDRLRGPAERIVDESDHLLLLINQVLDLSKVEAGALTLEPNPFSLRRLMASVEGTLRPMAVKKRLDLTCTVDPTAADWVIGDMLRLKQILLNLAGNAVKFTEKGHVALDLRLVERSEDKQVVGFAIEDTGIGIEESFRSAIFDRFTQGQSGSTRLYGGTGLGTTIAKQLAELMGGDINYSSQVGVGTTFTVTIPFGLASAESSHPEGVGDGSDKSQAVPNLAGARILLVEDYQTTRDIIVEYLAGTGAELAIAENGAEGLRACEHGTFDLVLMDVHMPAMDGHEATRRIRDLPGGSRIPVVGMTASAFEEDRAECKRAGMNDVLVKPFRRRELLARILAHIEPDPGDGRHAAGPRKEPGPCVVFDYEALVDEMGGRRDMARELVVGFVGHAKQQLALMASALRSGDHAGLHREAHAMKGGAMNIYAGRLQEAAEVVELRAKRQENDLEAQLAAVQSRVVELEEEVRRVLPPTQPPA